MKYCVTLSLFLVLLGCTRLQARAQKVSKFERWKRDFIARSSKRGLSKAFLTKQLKNISYDHSIIEKDRNQIVSDKSVNYDSWIEGWLNTTPNRIKQGQMVLEKYKELLDRIENIYKVDKEVIISLWGVETGYGKITGDYNVIAVLASLAFDRRRRKFFEQELLSSLKIIFRGHVSAEKFLGSWAGAFGECQFMPSTFLRRAQDFDGDGKIDIWDNHADIFASIANFLKYSKWKRGKDLGLLVNNSGNKRFNFKRLRTPAQFNKLGLRQLDGSKLKGTWRRRVSTIPFKNSPLILRGSNYRSIMRWNRSSLFAALNIILMDAFYNKL